MPGYSIVNAPAPHQRGTPRKKRDRHRERLSAASRARHDKPPTNSNKEEKIMSTKDVASKAAELKEMKAMQEEINAEITALEDEIKAEMTARGVDEMQAGAFKIRWTQVTSNRLDQSAIKSELPDIYARYCKESTSRRFCVA